ncbi:MAG: hypothetical protein A3G18_00465 [Rhodospirillales bacterium RIFCSPLOWO2_12_FULL_58_28]|nr:MAG: hypothetical protein A3H92_03070 [Rhodospirillales bacterium RIFCSPLOWO2_02_FULL_58_16]OHC79935.1 MAG: hypothetical protein A3G18_00465 [Rhodospirillales bacterium RIFCSPLOWO2_12_FULL_58_28]
MHKIFPALMLSIIAVSASAGQPFIEVFDRAVKKECGSCHMVFNPEMLPAKSWETIMKGLKNHFGKEVGLDEATVGKILSYFTGRSSDMSGSQNGRTFMEGINREEPPLRIIDTPRFKDKHQGIAADVWSREGIKARNNCVSCHVGALKGDYEARNAKIPDGK